MRFRGILLISILWSGAVAAQQAEVLVFNEKTFDFGAVQEEDGPVLHEFSFINNGVTPVKILRVKASCGCTTPGWTKEPINPGETGFVQAEYNPRNRPGTFNKSLTVTTDASPTPVRLYIRGKVVPKTKTVEEELPVELGDLRVKYRSFNMGKVLTTGETVTKSFEVYNDSDTIVTFLDTIEAPDHIKIAFEPQALKPAAKGLIKINYDAKTKGEFGFNSDYVNFFTKGRGDYATNSIAVYATIEEYFPPMTKAELENAPKLKVEENVQDLGKIKQSEIVSTTFTLTNDGVAPLNIRQVRSNCSCTKAELKKNTIKSGESLDIKVIFNGEGRRGNQQKSVTIYSNDPRASAQRLTIKAYILKN